MPRGMRRSLRRGIRWKRRGRGGHCQTSDGWGRHPHRHSIALVGHPNVGKSALFQRLTGQRVTISNYPGTTVEVVRGQARLLPETDLVDTPGVVTLPPHSEDERVTERLLLNEPQRAILQVGDAKNLRRTLLLTIQLAEMGLPLVLALNMMDEAEARGVELDVGRLTERLDITVIPTTAVRGQGVNALTPALEGACPAKLHLTYPAIIESGIDEILRCLERAGLVGAPVSLRALALMWLSDDRVAEDWLCERLGVWVVQDLVAIRQRLQSAFSQPLGALIQERRLEFVKEVSNQTQVKSGEGWRGLSVELGHLATNPLWGLFLLAAVLYGMYWFVGVFGAGTLVDFLEGRLFGEWINPWVAAQVSRLLPFKLAVDFLVGDFGLWTMGITYALALILPIVTTFFLAFGVLEDSGYLPRLAALSNRLFQAIGLNGKAVLPMVLGLGCVTMATLTTRMLESKRERLLVTLLLALAVPCSAQLGVVMGLLASISLSATLIWGGVVFIVLLAVGWLAARLVPGERSSLLVDLPPMRLPQVSNVLLKTLARLEWYLKEVVPLFLIGAAIMFVLQTTGILEWLVRAGEPLVTGWLGLPAEASAAFLMGFLRRDFGATGFFVLQSAGRLTPAQVVVGMVTITLFIPCLASVLMIARERGWRTTTGVLLVVFPLAILVGGILFRILSLVGWGL